MGHISCKMKNTFYIYFLTDRDITHHHTFLCTYVHSHMLNNSYHILDNHLDWFHCKFYNYLHIWNICWSNFYLTTETSSLFHYTPDMLYILWYHLLNNSLDRILVLQHLMSHCWINIFSYVLNTWYTLIPVLILNITLICNCRLGIQTCIDLLTTKYLPHTVYIFHDHHIGICHI